MKLAAIGEDHTREVFDVGGLWDRAGRFARVHCGPSEMIVFVSSEDQRIDVGDIGAREAIDRERA